jgi:1-acyl-sn-glycerol-3-phosphate acyltransferase
MVDATHKSLVLSFRNVFETLAISWPTVVDAARHRVSKPVCDDRLERWCKRVVDNAGIELTVIGNENVTPSSTYLVMSNHQSLYDIPVLFVVLGKKMRMITKSELFKVPIFGPAMREAGFIEIDRSNRTRALEGLAVAKRKLQEGTSVWIAPEGTRSRTGALSPFKKGGFQLALDTGWPVLPVTLKGTRDVLRAKGVRSVPGAKVIVSLHPVIDPKPYLELGKKGREALMANVRTSIESAL